MPIYEYACAGCDSEFEVEQRITDDPIKTCPKCSSRKVKRLISQTSFVLKGGGWYADAYTSSNTEAKSADDTKSEAGKDEVAPDAKKSSDSKSEKPASGAKKDGKKGKKGPKAAA